MKPYALLFTLLAAAPALAHEGAPAHLHPHGAAWLWAALVAGALALAGALWAANRRGRG